MKLSVMVLTYNGEHLLDDCLKSLGDIGDERMVIDNGSAQSGRLTEIALKNKFSITSLTKNHGNIGGINKCFEYASHEQVLFVSDDVRFKKITIFPEDNDIEDHVGQIMPIINNKDGSVQTCGLKWYWPGYGVSKKELECGCGYYCYCDMFDIDIVPSITFIMTKKLWKLSGGFDENLISSHEDVDMGLRLRNDGYQNMVSCNWEAVHLANSTLSKTLTNHSKRFHESRRMVIKKHYKGLDRWSRLAAESVIYGATSSMQSLREITK